MNKIIKQDTCRVTATGVCYLQDTIFCNFYKELSNDLFWFSNKKDKNSIKIDFLVK